MIDAEGATQEYRVETRNTERRGGWYPEGDHWSTTDRVVAEARLTEKADWYGNPERFEHRITARIVTPWEPIR